MSPTSPAAMTGAPAERTPGAGGGDRVLVPGRSAAAGPRPSPAGVHGRERDPQPAAGLRIHPPGHTESVVVPFPVRACASPAVQQLEMSGLGA